MNLCVSLDLPSAKENLSLLKEIKDFNIWIKIGFRSYIRDSKYFLQEIKSINPNFKIFLDLKLYDIPNTMADAAEEIANLGLVDMFNVHASSGAIAMMQLMDRINNISNRPLVLAVTALTSFDNESFKKIYKQDINSKVKEFAKDTYECGLDGVVCSAFESLEIKNNTSKNFITLCPGIRPFGEDVGDQKRVADLSVSKDNLVDFVVIGRPIYKASNPKEVVKRIMESIN